MSTAICNKYYKTSYKEYKVITMRLSNYIRTELKNASHIAFDDAKFMLFGSRVDDGKKGVDFDIVVMSYMDKESFRTSKIKFFKSLFLKDLDLPIDTFY